MTTPRLIFSEIDNTLVSSTYSLDTETISAIRKQIMNGNLFIPVSNRMPKAMTNVTGKITTASPLITYDGALVLDEMGQPLNSQFLTAQDAIKICNIVEENIDVVWNIYSGYNWLTQDSNNPAVQQYAQAVQVQPFHASLKQIENLKGVHKISIMGKHDKLIHLQKQLSTLGNFTFIFFNDETLDILDKNVSRVKALKIVSEYYFIDLKDCIGFGSLDSDKEMLEEIGNSYVTETASQEMKAMFPIVPQIENKPDFSKILAKFA